MKKTFLTLILGLFIFVTLCSAQEDRNTNFSSKNGQSLEESTDKVLSILEVAKNKQIKIEKTAEQLAEEKKEIELKKNELVVKKSESLTEDSAIKKQLKLLDQQSQLVEAKAMAIEERIEATEKVMAIIEQKIQLINREDLTLKYVISESRRIRKALIKDQKEKATLIGEIPLIKMEIEAIEKEMVAQKILIELKAKMKNEINDSLKANELRLETAQSEIDLINERISFVDVQIEIEKNYINILWEKRLDILKSQLFLPRKYAVDLLDVASLIFLFIGILFMFLNRHKVIIGENQSEKKISLVDLLKKSVVVIVLYFGGYFIISFGGYHELAKYLTYRIILIIFVTMILMSIYHVMKILFCKIVASGKEGSEERIIIKTFLDIVRTLFGWGFFFGGLFLVVDILGLRYEATGFIVEASQKPFFVLGNVKLSVWLLFKTLIILWIFIAGAKFLDGFLRKNVYKRMHLDESVQYTFSVTIKYVMLIIGFLVGLSAMGVELATLTVFAGTIGIGIGFGLQDIAKNFISGLVMLIERPVKVGDYVEVSDLPGKVRAIKARCTIVDTFDNISVIVPNSDFINQKVINWSYSDKVTRVKLSVGVAYGSDTELVRASLLEMAKSHGKVLRKPEPYVWFEEFGDSSLLFKLFIWTNDPENRFTLKSDLHYMIDKIFRERKITIAFPQTDIHFKSSDVSFK